MQRLRYMTPPLPLNDEEDGALAYAEEFCQHVQRNNTRAIHGANLDNLNLGQFCRSGARTTLGVKPTLYRAINHIVRVRSNKKMSRIAARAVVAFVAHLKSFWNWSVCKHPRNTMGDVSAKCAIAVSEPAVSVVGFTSKPWPTIIRATFLNLSPESGFGWCFGNHMGMHINF